MDNTKPKESTKEQKKLEAKWSTPLINAGWTAIPSIIFEKQEALGLDPIDLNIVAHLACYWFTPENLPHPSVGRIAKAMGVTPRTVQKRIKALVALGLLTKQERKKADKSNETNLYGFAGLIEAAKPFAEEKLEARAAKEAAEEARLARKKAKPALRLDRKSTRLNSSHHQVSRMPSSA